MQTTEGKTCSIEQNYFYKKRLITIVVLMLIIVGVFWGLSRYPSLLSELDRATDGTITERSVGFMSKDQILSESQDLGYVQRVIAVSMNWMYANRFGMTFGVVFGSAFLVFLKIVAPYYHRLPQRGLGGALVGMIAGMPLGICANCVVPLGVSTRSQGISSTPTLAMMVSSPTMNPIAFIIMLTAFPLAFVVMRLIGILAIIFGLVPTMDDDGEDTDSHVEIMPGVESYMHAMRSVGQDFLAALLKLARYMVGLMLLGGLLGAIIITAFPLENLLSFQESVIGLGLAIVMAAIIGVLLPVPIFAEIVFCMMLWQSGMHPAIIVTLLITLPATSVFSGIALWRDFSPRIALGMLSGIAIFGATAGVIMLYLV